MDGSGTNLGSGVIVRDCVVSGVDFCLGYIIFVAAVDCADLGAIVSVEVVVGAWDVVAGGLGVAYTAPCWFDGAGAGLGRHVDGDVVAWACVISSADFGTGSTIFAAAIGC